MSIWRIVSPVYHLWQINPPQAKRIVLATKRWSRGSVGATRRGLQSVPVDETIYGFDAPGLNGMRPTLEQYEATIQAVQAAP
jgi:hypothetical protein